MPNSKDKNKGKWCLVKGERTDKPFYVTLINTKDGYSLEHTFKIFMDKSGETLYLCGGSAPTQEQAMDLVEELLVSYRRILCSSKGAKKKEGEEVE